MNNNLKKILLIVLCILLVAELVFVGVTRPDGEDNAVLSTQPVYTGTPTEAPASAPTQIPTEPTVPVTEAPETEAPTEAPTEPTEQHFILTFAGDCTLGTDNDNLTNLSSFVKTVGEDYDYPFANVREYFESDDYTMINLEVALTDEFTNMRDKLFTFRGPTAYTQILTGSGVEGVTLANNHSFDYGQDGYDNTKAALEAAGVDYVEKDSSTIVTTESGLKIGIYAVDGSTSGIPKEKTLEGIRKLKESGVELIIVAAHWGNEGKYRPNGSQQELGKAMIDAGANIIYGHHPHVLQKIEEYNGGVICYSLGNFSFGGNTNPKDKDSAIVQQEVIRDVDGTIRLGERTVIPCSISSVSGYNNYQPTPMEEGSKEYERALSKLDGSFKGADLVVDYSKLEKDDPTEPPAQEPETDAPAETAPPAPPADDAGASGGDAGASDGDAGASGGDAGASGGDAGASGGDAGASGGDAGASGGDAGASGGDAGAPEG